MQTTVSIGRLYSLQVCFLVLYIFFPVAVRVQSCLLLWIHNTVTVIVRSQPTDVVQQRCTGIVSISYASAMSTKQMKIIPNIFEISTTNNYTLDSVHVKMEAASFFIASNDLTYFQYFFTVCIVEKTHVPCTVRFLYKYISCKVILFIQLLCHYMPQCGASSVCWIRCFCTAYWR